MSSLFRWTEWGSYRIKEMSAYYLKALQRPIQTSPTEMVVMPSLRLRMPNRELLFRISARCFSSCDIPEK